MQVSEKGLPDLFEECKEVSVARAQVARWRLAVRQEGARSLRALGYFKN